MANTKIESTAEAWEDRALGSSEVHVAVADEGHEAALDAALGLQSISIRLPRQLIEHYRLIAHFHDVGYQPLMRDVLQRFVPNALREILEAEREKAENAQLAIERAERERIEKVQKAERQKAEKAQKAIERVETTSLSTRKAA